MRTFIIAMTAAAALCSFPAFTQDRNQGSAPLPDLSGLWANPYLYGIELPRSGGPGPVVNTSRRPQTLDADGRPYRAANAPLVSDNTVPHPAQVAPSWYGDSVGHYEGDTLVIDTVGLRVGPFSAIDQYGTPYTRALHVVERYRLIDYEAAREAWERGGRENIRGGIVNEGYAPDPNYKGKALQLQFTVQDEGVFTTAWSATKTYRRVFRDWPERVCAENPYRYGTEKDAAVPTAGRPDF
jgi:hypothetical protein